MLRQRPLALLGVVALLWALGGAQGEARASKPHCRLERVDVSELDQSGVLRVIGGVVELEGLASNDHPAKDFRLVLGNKTVGRAERMEMFERSGHDLYIILAVEISALYAPAFDKIKDALHDFLESMPHARVKLIQFGTDIELSPTFMPAPAVSQELDDINPDDQGEVKLLDAVSAGLVALNKLPAAPANDKSGHPRPPPRKVMVVLSDGLNSLMDRKSFKRVGDLLKQSNVPLFPVGFSPRDDRGPLLNLGELAKRSTGTFRWAPKEENLKEQFQNLAEELNKAPVLTFPAKKLETDQLASAAFTLQCGELKSLPLHLSGAPPPKASTWWKWVLGVLGSLIGLWGLAQGALWLLKRRSQQVGGGPPGAPRPAGQANYAGTAPAGSPAHGTLPPSAAVGYPAPAGGRVYTATLIGIGALGGQRLKVEASLRLGSAPASPGSFQIPGDPTVAPAHCDLRRDGAGFALYDLGSPAGSFVNERRVAGSVHLNDGDLLRLGDGTQLKFRIDD
jgi:hypothetical protein